MSFSVFPYTVRKLGKGECLACVVKHNPAKHVYGGGSVLVDDAPA
jgi:hypothetical protein